MNEQKQENPRKELEMGKKTKTQSARQNRAPFPWESLFPGSLLSIEVLFFFLT